jgi:hypothetical protein
MARKHEFNAVIAQLSACAEAYYRRHGFWPPVETEAGLLELFEADASRLVVPMKRRGDGRVLDPWGRLLHYSTHDEVTIASAGRNGVLFTWDDLIDIVFPPEVLHDVVPLVACTLPEGWSFSASPHPKQRVAVPDSYSGPEPRPSVLEFYARDGDEKLYPLRFGPPGLKLVDCVPFDCVQVAKSTRTSYAGRWNGKNVRVEQFIFALDGHVHVFTCTVADEVAAVYLPQFIQTMSAVRPLPARTVTLPQLPGLSL